MIAKKNIYRHTLSNKETPNISELQACFLRIQFNLTKNIFLCQFVVHAGVFVMLANGLASMKRRQFCCDGALDHFRHFSEFTKEKSLFQSNVILQKLSLCSVRVSA